MTAPLLVVDAEVDGVTGVDVRIEAGRIVAVGPDLSRAGAELVDAGGGALIPGLTDHHLHLHATAADAASVRCGPPAVRGAGQLAAALAAAPVDAHGWVRGVGYIESVAGDLDAAALDRLHRDRPTRIQHRSGAMWVLNSAAVAATGLVSAEHPGVERDATGAPTGRVWRADDWLRTRLPTSGPPSLAAVGAALTGFGITSVTDATPDLRPDSQRAIEAAMTSGDLPQRVHLLGAPLAEPGRGDSSAGPTVGPYKIVLADSGLPDLDTLAGTIRAAHAARRPVAVHCVTREALLILLVVLDEVGTVPGDRIEHGAVVPRETLTWIRRLGLRVVTQPGFLADRGDDYLRDVDPADQPDLYRCRSLLDAGIPVALSSDAPYGPLDPWRVIAAAVDRRAPTGDVVGADERLAATEALNGYLAPVTDPGGPARRVVVGADGDVVLLHSPLAEVLAAPTADAVRRTVLAYR
ncbi:amidohydrolase family protein [Rhodococcus sp. NPDC003318]|uniref:amidohydrolase family protein n=1 Tax=Rhodococcus sp. NPDC003318 TaxID=3364503 RepID=UPI0036A55045